MPLVQAIGRLVLVVLLGGLLAQALIVFAPGYTSDERELEPGLSEPERRRIQLDKLEDKQLFSSYGRFLGRVIHGDFGQSKSMNRPVRELLADRLPVTLRLIGKAIVLGWGLGLALALICASSPLPALKWTGILSSNLLLCLPAAVLALLLLLWGDRARGAEVWVVALSLTPRIFRYSYNLMEEIYQAPHILAAKAKGIGPLRILLRHALPPVSGQLLALAGITVSLGLSAAIPAEVVLDIPGIGQLAWQAAMSRDLNLLVSLTFLVALVTTAANTISEHWIELEVPRQ